MSAVTEITFVADTIETTLSLVESPLSPSPVPLTVQEEGVTVASRRIVNLTGAGVTAVDNPAENRIDITIEGGGTSDDITNESAVDGATVTNALNTLSSASTGITRQTAYIKPSVTTADDLFGGSVAIDGDTMVVGSLTGVGGGFAEVFVRVAGVWTFQQRLTGSNTEAGDLFGGGVAVADDTIVVSALYESSNATGINGNQSDNSVSQSGAVYVFTRSGSTWTQQAYIKASNTGAADYFGGAVSLSADGNTLAVGAAGEDSNATGIGGDQSNNSLGGSGAVYVFTRSGSTWTQQAYIKASNTGAADYFGGAVSLSADGDTLAVAAAGEDSNATGIGGDQSNNSLGGSGAVYVFTRSGSTWTQQAYIKASNTGAGDEFGSDVSLYGDTLVVGAGGEASNATGIDGDQTNNSAYGAGAVYVFTRTAGVWTQQAYLKPPAAYTELWFGYDVALYGDRLAVGAYADRSGIAGVNGSPLGTSQPDSGAVHVFTRSGVTWAQSAYIKASTPDGSGILAPPYDEFGDEFGHGLALYGSTLVTGAASEDSNATGIDGDQSDNSAPDSGAAYVIEIGAAAREDDPRLFGGGDGGGAPAAHASSHAAGGGDDVTLTTAQITGLDAALAARILSSEKASALGVATLDAGGKIPVAQIPATAITDTFVVASQAAMLAISAEVGDVAVRSDLSKTFILAALPPGTLGNWQELLTPTDTVTSVNGETGAVSLSPSDISAKLGAFDALTWAADKSIYFTDANTAATYDLTAAGRAMAAAATAAAQVALLPVATTSAAGTLSAADKLLLDESMALSLGVGRYSFM